MPDYAKPLPIINDLNRPHWEGARRREFRVQRCTECGHLWFPPMPNCSACLSPGFEWIEVSGKGTVYSYIVYHQGWLPGYRDDLPYNVAIIELDEGIRLINNVVSASHNDLAIGMRVEAVYEDVTAEITIPRFKPSGN